MKPRSSGRNITCSKIDVHPDGNAVLPCRGVDGQPLLTCAESSDYRDAALPLSEQLCDRTIAEHQPHMNDAFKSPYVSVCHNLDETLADQFKANSSENLNLRFEAMERVLSDMIRDPELSRGDKGRYLYHIDARVLHAFLPAFWHRAEFGIDAEMPDSIIDDTYEKIGDILSDFDGIYEGIATQVALRRTEVEILALLLRTRDAEFFPFPALFREDASETRSYNHDAYIVYDKKKLTVQIKNTDYKTKNGENVSSDYIGRTVVAIHQKVVNLDYIEGETHVTRVEDEPVSIEHEHDVVEDYDEYDEQPRFVAWGATDAEDGESNNFIGEYVQVLGSEKRDGLITAIVKEAKKHKLTLNERNLLNGASHYLMAVVREKQAAERHTV